MLLQFRKESDGQPEIRFYYLISSTTMPSTLHVWIHYGLNANATFKLTIYMQLAELFKSRPYCLVLCRFNPKILKFSI